MKKLKSYVLLALFSIGLATTPTASARNNDFFLWAIGAAVVGASIGIVYKICQAFQWSDQDILSWARSGVENCDEKYQNLNRQNGSVLARLQLFGNRHTAPWSACSTEAETATRNNPNLAPLHNALLVIKGDIHQLREYNRYLLDRNLTGQYIGRDLLAKIASIIASLEQIKDIVLASHEYTVEEQSLQQKVHQLRQERIERERNDVLREQAQAMHRQADAQHRQANAQHRQANAQFQQVNTPTVVIITGQDSLLEEIERLEEELEAVRWSLQFERIQQLEARLAELRRERAHGRA